MTNFNVGDRVKVKNTAAFSSGSVGTIIEISDAATGYNCFIKRDSASDTDRMGFYFPELKLLTEDDAPFGEEIHEEQIKKEIIELAKELYIEWCSTVTDCGAVSEEKINEDFGWTADFSFKIAEIWVRKSKEYGKI